MTRLKQAPAGNVRDRYRAFQAHMDQLYRVEYPPEWGTGSTHWLERLQAVDRGERIPVRGWEVGVGGAANYADYVIEPDGALTPVSSERQESR